jgi:hypothetical protein
MQHMVGAGAGWTSPEVLPRRIYMVSRPGNNVRTSANAPILGVLLPILGSPDREATVRSAEKTNP